MQTTMTTTPAEPEAIRLLRQAHRTLTEIETILVHASEPTSREITALLAAHADNLGGHALLIDTVQLDARAIEHYLNNDR